MGDALSLAVPVKKIPGREARTTAAVVRSLVDAEVLYSLGNGNRVHINTASSLSLFVCFPSFRLRLLSFIVVFLLFFKPVCNSCVLCLKSHTVNDVVVFKAHILFQFECVLHV